MCVRAALGCVSVKEKRRRRRKRDDDDDEEEEEEEEEEIFHTRDAGENELVCGYLFVPLLFCFFLICCHIPSLFLTLSGHPLFHSSPPFLFFFLFFFTFSFFSLSSTLWMRCGCTQTHFGVSCWCVVLSLSLSLSLSYLPSQT